MRPFMALSDSAPPVMLFCSRVTLPVCVMLTTLVVSASTVGLFEETVFRLVVPLCSVMWMSVPVIVGVDAVTMAAKEFRLTAPVAVMLPLRVTSPLVDWMLSVLPVTVEPAPILIVFALALPPPWNCRLPFPLRTRAFSDHAADRL